MSSHPHLYSEIESPRPLQATEGCVSIKGWFFFANEIFNASVRLRTSTALFESESSINRPDVAALFPAEPAARRCGFLIQGKLPQGLHQCTFEAQHNDGSWHCFKELSLIATPPEFIATLDSPVSKGTLKDRVKVGGWALHPTEPLVELSLHYGHRELPCTLGLPREDVPALYPDIPHAKSAGFISSDFLWAGHGPVRLRGKLASGRSVVFAIPVTFSIDQDENHAPDLNLTDERIQLPRNLARPASPVSFSPSTFNILFILHGSFASNSALHVAALANELCAMGHDCVATVTHDLETVRQLQAPAFRSLLHAEALHKIPFENQAPPDIIHAWTTREQVRILTEQIRQLHPTSKIVIHLEDNEQQVLAHALGLSSTEIDLLPTAQLDQLVPPHLSHPKRAGDFLESADGITVITETLREFVPRKLPCQTILPAADARYFTPYSRPQDFREIIDLKPDTTTIFYHGNVHSANASEVRELYSAVAILNRSGESVTLIRTGLDTVDFLGDLEDEVSPHVISLGLIPDHHLLPPLMALADLFVQPGSPDAFNDYRFPSKLPEFFSIGRPVILPRTNLGKFVRHGIDAYVLDHADAKGIAQAVQALRHDTQLYQTLSKGAVEFAREHFNWRRSAETLANFYTTLTRS